MFYIYEIQQVLLLLCACVHNIWTVLFSVWRPGESENIIKQVVNVSRQLAHLIYFVLIFWEGLIHCVRSKNVGQNEVICCDLMIWYELINLKSKLEVEFWNMFINFRDILNCLPYWRG